MDGTCICIYYAVVCVSPPLFIFQGGQCDALPKSTYFENQNRSADRRCVTVAKNSAIVDVVSHGLVPSFLRLMHVFWHHSCQVQEKNIC